MIQKRYQYYSKSGIIWTPWRDYSEDDSLLSKLQEEEKWQIKGKLRNEYKVV